MEKNYKPLELVAGAWVDRGHARFMKVAMKCEYDLSLVTPKVRKVVIEGLRTAVVGSSGGQAAHVFMILSEVHNLKYVCASETGCSFYANFNNKDFMLGCKALMQLQKGPSGYAREHMHQYDSSLRCWSWPGGANTVRRIYEETVGYPDKEIREKAIDFLCEGGKLSHTWIARDPR